MVVVFLPGLHGTGGLFGPLLAELPARIRRRVVEHPTGRVCGYRKLAARVEKMLEGEDAVVLVAESFSGALALEVARRSMGRVKGVVLCGSFVTAPVPRLFCILGSPLALLGCPLPGWAIRMFLSGWNAEGELVRAVRREVGRNWPHVLAFRVLQAGWIDGRGALARCGVPVLVLAGTKDRLVGRRSVRRIVRARKDVAVAWITGGPHLLAQVKAREVWREVEGFMETLGEQ